MGGGGIGEVAESIRQAVSCGEEEIEPGAARAEAAAELGLVVLKRTVTSPLRAMRIPTATAAITATATSESARGGIRSESDGQRLPRTGTRCDGRSR